MLQQTHVPGRDHRPLPAPSPLPSAEEQVLLDLARLRHSRRQLHAAVAHGIALFSALGIPRPVDGGFEAIDPEAAGDALDDAIAVLDALDADPDLEPEELEDSDTGEDDGTGEPSLGAPERHPSCIAWLSRDDGFYQSQIYWSSGSRQDREQEVTDEPHDEDTDIEHSLGSLGQLDQARWSHGSNSDLEDANEDGGQDRIEDRPFAALDYNLALGQAFGALIGGAL